MLRVPDDVPTEPTLILQQLGVVVFAVTRLPDPLAGKTRLVVAQGSVGLSEPFGADEAVMARTGGCACIPRSDDYTGPSHRRRGRFPTPSGLRADGVIQVAITF